MKQIFVNSSCSRKNEGTLKSWVKLKIVWNSIENSFEKNESWILKEHVLGNEYLVLWYEGLWSCGGVTAGVILYASLPLQVRQQLLCCHDNAVEDVVLVVLDRQEVDS